MAQKHKWSGVYLWCNFLNGLLQKIPTLVTLTATRTEVYIDTMNIFMSYSYSSLQGTINHLNIVKIESYPSDNVAYSCDDILVDFYHLESYGELKPEHLGYITQFLKILLTEYFDFK